MDEIAKQVGGRGSVGGGGRRIFKKFCAVYLQLRGIHILRGTLHGLNFYAGHFFSSESSWTPKTQPNDSFEFLVFNSSLENKGLA